MIGLKEALIIHSILIEQFGGSQGLRDEGLLDSALKRPYVTFDNQELYIHPADKAAALLESILINHPFVDGNKRTGYVLMRIMLLENGFDIQATQAEKYNFVIKIASGEMNIASIKEWIFSHLIK